MNDNHPNHDFAIRRFCPARIEEQEQGDQSQGHQEAPITTPDETEFSSSDAATTSTPCLTSSDVVEFVDSFINMDQHDDTNEHANEEDQAPQENHHHHHYNQTYDNHFMVNDEDEVADPFFMMNEEAYEYVYNEHVDP